MTHVYINGGYAFSAHKTAERIEREMASFTVVERRPGELYLVSSTFAPAKNPYNPPQTPSNRLDDVIPARRLKTLSMALFGVSVAGIVLVVIGLGLLIAELLGK